MNALDFEIVNGKEPPEGRSLEAPFPERVHGKEELGERREAVHKEAERERERGGLELGI